METLSKIPVSVWYAGFALIAFIVSVFAGLYIISVYKKVRFKITKDSAELDADGVADEKK